PGEAVALPGELVVGNRADAFVALRGAGTAIASLPDARAFPRLPAAALRDDPTPIYGRAPDARPMATP
ncbi:MAG: tRNA (adenosine(37)-N6)-threonylcarbamoyltransferase complex dimerization subunit type 1 TsaB, partial [Sphingopyxis sp.]|nr:tRNA (adenosine(37)-N6)-threonylcarbamoyltransferase complex dimerization subunit type 1 TsaB [Sphingopyxis sp.]